MTFLILSVTPVRVFAEDLISSSLSKSVAESEAPYGGGGAIPKELLSPIRRAAVYFEEEEESRRYYLRLWILLRRRVFEDYIRRARLSA